MNEARVNTLLERSDAAATYGILAAGIVHTGLTPVFKPEGGEEALWFAGSGLALCFLGALNLLRKETGASPAVRWWCRGANVVSAVFLLLVARALQAPHVYGVLGLVGLAIGHSFGPPKQP